MTIDLTTCVPGQRLRLRNGKIGIYKRPQTDALYPHVVVNDFDFCQFYQNNGKYLHDDLNEPEDVVEILPLEGVFTAKISPDCVETNGTGFWAVYQGETDDN